MPAWQTRYAELRNRQDSAGDLSHEERAELDQLEIRASNGASTTAAELRTARGDDATNIADLIPKILASPGARKFGFNEANLAGMAPAAVSQIAAGLGLTPPAGGTAGAAQPPPPPPTPPPAPGAAAFPPPATPPTAFVGGITGGGLGNAAPAIGANLGGVPAFDRPQPVVVMGPVPLSVRVVGGTAGAGMPGAEQPEREPGKFTGLTEHLDHLLNVLSYPSPGRNQSGPNLARLTGGLRGTYGRLRGGFARLGRQFQTGRRAAGGRAAAGRAAGGEARIAAAARTGAAAGPEGAVVAGGAAAAGEAAGAGAGAVGIEAAAAAGPVGVAVAGVVALGVAAVEAGKQVYAFARSQEAEIRKLAEVGGVQAASTARLDAERIGRDIRTAQETGGSSAQLIESLNRLEEAFRPIESLLTNVANSIGSGLADIVTDIITNLQPMVEAVKGLYEFFAGRATPSNIPATAFDQIRALDNEEWKARQPRWPTPRGRTP